MVIFYDTRTDRLVERPGLDNELSEIELKRGGEAPFSVQFIRSTEPGASVSVQSEPQFTIEELPVGYELWIGIKPSGEFEGDPLCLEKVSVWDAANKWYDMGLGMNSTELNAALLHDSDDGTNDIASIDDAMFEVKYRDSVAVEWRASINQVTAIINHNVLDGDEATPASASDTTAYPYRFIEKLTASASATLEFTDLTSSYKKYIISLEDFLPATDAVTLHMRFSDDNGSTWLSGAAGDGWTHGLLTSAYNHTDDLSDSEFELSGSVGTAAGEDGICGDIKICSPANDKPTQIKYELSHVASTAVFTGIDGFGHCTESNIIDAVQLYFSSGNIASGSAHLYGIIE